jgi:hypothetical protein
MRMSSPGEATTFADDASFRIPHPNRTQPTKIEQKLRLLSESWTIWDNRSRPEREKCRLLSMARFNQQNLASVYLRSEAAGLAARIAEAGIAVPDHFEHLELFIDNVCPEAHAPPLFDVEAGTHRFSIIGEGKPPFEVGQSIMARAFERGELPA